MRHAVTECYQCFLLVIQASAVIHFSAETKQQAQSVVPLLLLTTYILLLPLFHTSPFISLSVSTLLPAG